MWNEDHDMGGKKRAMPGWDRNERKKEGIGREIEKKTGIPARDK